MASFGLFILYIGQIRLLELKIVSLEIEQLSIIGANKFI